MYDSISFSSNEELEPRRIPHKTTNYDDIPIISVPEVSIISNESSIAKSPIEPRISKTPVKISETFAYWKNKNNFSPQKTNQRISESPLTSKARNPVSRILHTSKNESPSSPTHNENVSQQQKNLEQMGDKEIIQQRPNLAHANEELQYHGMPQPHFMYPVYSPEAFSNGNCYRQKSCNCGQKNNDDADTIKNLLLLIKNQGEQIKSLQSQIDKLLKLHEETLKDKKKCSNCEMFEKRENNQWRKSAFEDVEENLTISKKNDTFAQGRKGEKNQKENAKSSFYEKVSIGVMTSFEFKIQNSNGNLSAIDVEKLEESEKEQVFRNKMSEPLQQIRPTNQKILSSLRQSGLDNINEDSESHLSSSQPRNHEKSVSRSREETIDENDRNNVHLTKDRHNLVPRDGRFERVSPLSKINSHPNNKIYDNRKFEDRMESVTRNDQWTNQTNFTELDQMNDVDESIVLNGEELHMSRMAPSPDPSIHVEMQGYSSDGSVSPPNHTPNIGWTFYNKVMKELGDRVDEILHGAPAKTEPLETRIKQDFEGMDPVEAATFDQLAKMGFNFNEEPDDLSRKNRLNADTTYYPRFDAEMYMAQGTSAVVETNTSMRMKALAMKYLKKEELSNAVTEDRRTGNVEQVMHSMEETNLSFAAMHYLERYKLLGNQGGGNYHVEATAKAENENARFHNINSRNVKASNPKAYR